MTVHRLNPSRDPAPRVHLRRTFPRVRCALQYRYLHHRYHLRNCVLQSRRYIHRSNRVPNRRIRPHQILRGHRVPHRGCSPTVCTLASCRSDGRASRSYACDGGACNEAAHE